MNTRKCTVKQLRKALAKLPDDYEVFLYPKYADFEDGPKFAFHPSNVCLQHPGGEGRSDDDPYFDGRKPERYDKSKHVAIIF